MLLFPHDEHLIWTLYMLSTTTRMLHIVSQTRAMDVLKIYFSIGFACFCWKSEDKQESCELLSEKSCFFFVYPLMYFCDIRTLAFLSVLFMFDKLRTPKGFVI